MDEQIIYHVYNRGAHKENIFRDASDYCRMIKLLYIANNSEPFKIHNLPENIFSISITERLIDIVAYCLMPNHIHLAVILKPGHNLSKFMLKFATAYSVYFNLKYKHSGTLWEGPYKIKTAYDVSYADQLIEYIHNNPYSLKYPKLAKVARRYYTKEEIEFSSQYEFSSFKDYLGICRPQAVILNKYQARPS